MRSLLIALPVLVASIATPFATTVSSDPTPRPASAAGLAAAEYDVDSLHSSLIFRVKHVGASYFFGRFNKIEGGMTFDPKALDKTQIEIVVDATSVDTNNKNRDDHLRGPDFFDAKQFRSMTFVGEKMSEVSDGVYEVTGELEMRGVKKKVSGKATYVGTGEFRGSTRVGFEVKFSIKRTDFGVSYGADSGVLGDQVDIMIGLEMVKG